MIQNTLLLASTKGPDIGNAVSAGDLAGNWWMLHASGVMEPGSSLTLSSVGSPSVNPITLNGSSQYFISSPVAFPTGDFSFVTVINVVTNPGYFDIISKYPSFTILEGDNGGGLNFFVTTSTSANADASATFATGVWLRIGGVYTSATSTAKLRIQGVNHSNIASGTGVNAGSATFAYGARNNGTLFSNILSRGGFFTEKVLSDADIDRICAGAI